MLKLVETFSSVQGEGQNTGINTLFIRLYGCNLACSFCDEPKHTNAELIKEYTVNDIVEMAKESRVRWVCITGGEPTLQDLRPLIGALQAVGLKVQVETNGYNLSNCGNADLITCSPKETTIPEGWDELKIIIPAQEHLLPYLTGKSGVYLQPENYEHTVNMDNVAECLNWLVTYPEFGISVQLHKLLGVE